MLKKNLKKSIFGFVISMMPFLVIGQGTEAPMPKTPLMDEKSMILILIIVLLFLPLYLTGKMFLVAAKDYMIRMKNRSNANKIINTLLILFAFTQISFSQATPAPAHQINFDWSSWGLFSCIVVEIFLIAYFSWQTTKFLKSISAYEKEHTNAVNESWIERLWNKINSFKPIEEEASIDVGHNYDGIRELDNITPPWFTAGFLFTIVFGLFYLWRYHVSHSAPLQVEEFKMEMAQAEIDKSKYLSMQANNVDENSVKMLEAPDIAAGKAIFTEKCIACHEAHGGSKAGGVGPNLTDDYWIHGGSIKNIFTSIKYGWPDKGMISWKDQLSANQMAQVASFVKSLKGSNPAGAKEKQGELYVEQQDTIAPVVTDTVNIKK